MRKSLVSIVALGLFAGAPAMAQTTTDEATNQTQQQQTQQQSTQQKSTQQQSTQQGTQQQSTQQQTTGSQQQTAQQQRAPNAEQLQQMLSAYEERSEIDGFIARATDADGNPVLVLVTPSDFESESKVKAQENDLRDRLQQSRFNGVEMLQQPTIVRAIVDENNHIIALSATRIVPSHTQTSGLSDQTGTESQTGSQAQSGTQGQTGSQAQMGTQSQTGSQAQSGTQGQTGSQDQTAMTQGQTGETGTSGASGAVTGGEPSTMLSEDDSATGQTGSEMGQTGSEMGQTDTDMSRDATELSQTDTDTTVEMGQTDTVMQMDPESGATGTDSGDSQTQAGQTGTESGQVGRALSEAGAGRIVSDLQEAGIDNPAEFQGRIVRARTSDGAPVFFMISSQDMQAGAAGGINEDEVRKNLEQADLQDIQFIGDAKLLRGEMDGDQVFVLAGSDLMGSSAQQSGQQQ